MASYGLEARFKDPRDCFRLTDPTAYNHSNFRKICGKNTPNKYGFLSASPRKTECWRAPYTDNIYDAKVEHKIPNVASLKATTPRFSFKPFNEEELDNILCTCDLEDTCVCPTVPVVCEAYRHKRIFKGPPPHSVIGDGISIPTKRDRGFEILNDGSARRLLDIVKEECPPFYDTRAHNPTCEFYHGCKWSHWRTPRMGPKSLEVRPGPADYTIEKEKTQFELCMERIRAKKRNESKQLRYIELVQEKNIREGRVGPADYNPQMPKGTDLKFLGPKQVRFPVSKYEDRPSPATYSLKRDCDLPEPPIRPCLAKLPAPACFGIRSDRFKTRVHQSPGPAEYDAGVKLCNILHCSDAPFGCSAKRFKEEKIDIEPDLNELAEEGVEEEENVNCPKVTWQFRSKTKRFRSTKTDFDPLIPYLRTPLKERPVYLQALSPFNTSQGRFQPWFDWLAIHTVNEPGPGTYDAEKARCLPAVKYGPLCRARRFRDNIFLTPAPNEHKIEGGVEDVLKTHNKRLKENVEHREKRFKWIPPPEPRIYSFEERELMILEKAIKQLEIEEERSLVVIKEESVLEDTVLPGSKRVSAQVGDKRVSIIDREKLVIPITDKRASTEKDETRGSADKSERHVSVKVGERQGSSDAVWAESQRESDKLGTPLPDRTETNIPALRDGIQVINIMPRDENKSPEPNKIDVVVPKQKMLRSFLHKHRMPVYF